MLVKVWHDKNSRVFFWEYKRRQKFADMVSPQKIKLSLAPYLTITFLEIYPYELKNSTQKPAHNCMQIYLQLSKLKSIDVLQCLN